MKRFFLIVLVAAACTRPPTKTAEATEIRTIGNSPVSTIPVQPPPTLDDPSFTRPAPASRNTTKAAKGDAETPTQQDELSRKMNLPFAPPIAMDPVDGSKVSISSSTPMFEYKDRLYYFSSAKNRQLFAANPDGYLKDKLAAY